MSDTIHNQFSSEAAPARTESKHHRPNQIFFEMSTKRLDISRVAVALVNESAHAHDPKAIRNADYEDEGKQPIAEQPAVQLRAVASNEIPLGREEALTRASAARAVATAFEGRANNVLLDGARTGAAALAPQAVKAGYQPETGHVIPLFPSQPEDQAFANLGYQQISNDVQPFVERRDAA